MTHLTLPPADFDRQQVNLSQQNLLVTGADTDIGHHISLALAGQGATLQLVTRKQRQLSDLYDQIVELGAPEPLIIEFDTSKAAADHYTQLASGLATECTSLHGLINLELSAAPLSPLELSTPDTWERCLQQLLLRPMQMTKALLPLLKLADNSSVIYQSLAAGRQGNAYWGPVGAACAALENMSQTLADEHSDIRFNTLDFGKVNSALRHKFYPAEAISTLRRFDDPLISDAILWLISADSRKISGEMTLLQPLI